MKWSNNETNDRSFWKEFKNVLLSDDGLWFKFNTHQSSAEKTLVHNCKT